MKPPILFCILSAVILLISACAAPQLKKSDLLIEPSIKKDMSEEKPIAVHIETFGIAKTISNPSVVGEARTGMLNARKPITSEETVHSILTDQIKKAFQKAGFKVEEKEKAKFSISGRIERFWADERIGGVTENVRASVKYDLIIKDRNGNFLWGDNIVGRATSGKSMDATKDDIPTLVNALKKSIESIFENESFWKAIEQ